MAKVATLPDGGIYIQLLEKQVCMGLGRWSPRNEIQGSEMRTVHFNIRKL